MAEETATIESAPAEPSANFDTSALDAILNRSLPDAPPAEPAPAAEPVATKEKPAEAAPPTPAPVVDDPLTPPPSVLGEEEPVTPAADAAEEKFPETPEGGFKSKKQENDWRKWGERYEAQSKELKLLREAHKNPGEPDKAAKEQVAALQGQIMEMQKFVERTNLENSPAFLNQFSKPIEGLKAKAVEAARAAGIDGEALEKALRMTGEKRLTAIAELTANAESSLIVRRIERTVDDIEAKESERDAVLADVHGNVAKMAQIERQQRFEQAQVQEKNLNATVDQVVDYLGNKHGFDFLKKSTAPGAEKWNARIDQDIAEIRELAIKNQDPNKLLLTLALGTQTPHYKQYAASLREQLKAANAKIAEMQGSVPNLDGKPAKLNGNGATEIDPNEDLVQAANRMLREMNAG